MSAELLRGIAAQEQLVIKASSSVSGGDINLAFKLQTDQGDLFLKANAKPQGHAMLLAEAKGLAAMSVAEAIEIPKVLAVGQFQNYAYLLMPFVAEERPGKLFWEKLALGLYDLHNHQAEQSGLDHDNFIGSLTQSNHPNGHWPTFYWQERLQPQIDLALKNGQLTATEINLFEALKIQLPTLLPAIGTNLLHGDLWSGNFLCGPGQTPFLVDPACYHGHYEVDLAMSQLFGGFDPLFYSTYLAQVSPAKGLEERLKVYQLYYLLVHLNLFGRSYWPAIASILKKYV